MTAANTYNIGLPTRIRMSNSNVQDELMRREDLARRLLEQQQQQQQQQQQREERVSLTRTRDDDEQERRTPTTSTRTSRSCSSSATSTTTTTTTARVVSTRNNDSGFLISGDEAGASQHAAGRNANSAPSSYEEAVEEGERLWYEVQRVQRKLRELDERSGSTTALNEEGANDVSSTTTGRNRDGTGSEGPYHHPAPSSEPCIFRASTSASAVGETLLSDVQRVRRKLQLQNVPTVQANEQGLSNTSTTSLRQEDETTLHVNSDNNIGSTPETYSVGNHTLVPRDVNLRSTIKSASVQVGRQGIGPGAHRVRPQGVAADDDHADDENENNDNDSSECDNFGISVTDGSTEHSQSVGTESTVPYGGEGLVSAKPIYEEEEDMKPSIVAQATPLRRRKRLVVLILLIVVLVAVGIAVAIALTTQNNGGGSSSPTSAPTAPIPLNMSVLLEQFLDELPAETAAAVNVVDSPQSKAYQWINTSVQLNSTFFQQESPKSILSRMTQRFALATLYYATSGPTEWINPLNWLDANVDECSWSGCTCSSGPGVYGLDLTGKGLDGTIPLEVSFLATSLNILRLTSNTLKGTLPSQLGMLSSLQQLYASSAELQGNIPTSFGLMTALTWLDLSQNALKGPIPSTFGNLTSLSYLVLSDNSLSGKVPPELGLATNLDSLHITGNNLSGEFPPEICALVPNGLVVQVDCSTLSCNCCGC